MAPQLLLWSSYQPLVGSSSPGATEVPVRVSGDTCTATLDLTTGQVSDLKVTNTKHDMFCSGAS